MYFADAFRAATEVNNLDSGLLFGPRAKMVRYGEELGPWVRMVKIGQNGTDLFQNL